MMSEQITHEYIYELALSQDGNTRFAAQSSGLYHFDGLDWHNALTSLDADSFAVTAVTLSPNYDQDRTLFAGTMGVILRSLDGGESWQAFALPGPAPIITALAIAPDFADSGTIYAATLEDGIFVSTDRGASWNAWNFGLIGFSVNALAVEQGGVLVAGTELGVFQSTNTGRSWRAVAVFDTAVTAPASANGGLWVGTEDMGLWWLHDGNREHIAPEVVTGTVDRIIVDDSTLLVLCDNELLLARDHGVTWHNVANESAVSALAAPAGLAAGATVLVGNENGTIQTLIFAST